MSQEHFIKNIEIKNFKLFKDFKAEGFGRVNLIGGKNNVGKTAFMEACFLSQAESTEDLFSKLLEIKTHRDVINNLLSKNSREEDLRTLVTNNIGIGLISTLNDKRTRILHTILHNGLITILNIPTIKESSSSLQYEIVDNKIELGGLNLESYNYTLTNIIDILNTYLENTKINFSINYISIFSNSNNELENIIGDLKLNKKYNQLNNYLKKVFNVDSIDIIKDKPMLEINGNYLELSEFGQGIKGFINIITSLLLLENSYLFIDEIENGIHYSNYDTLWKIILTISKEQNVQVFATTHSKECIESYARVAKELKDKDITFFKLGRNQQNELKGMVYPYDWFIDSIKQEEEVRGW